jgi:hypothetical protein
LIDALSTRNDDAALVVVHRRRTILAR